MLTNLIHIKPINICNNNLDNVRSINNKTTTFLDNIIDEKLDICMITKTWLKHEDDVIRTAITPDKYKFLDRPRSNGHGGEFVFLPNHVSDPS